MVPNGWSDSRVKDVVKSLDAGTSVNSEDDKDLLATFKILKTSCVSKGIFDPKEVKTVKDAVEVERLKEPVLSNSIIISRMNTPLLVGANAYIDSAPQNTFLPDRLWQVKPQDSTVDMCWLGYWFGSSHTRYTLSSNATGTSGSMKNITKPDVMSMKLPLPPLPEQRKIAKILSAWDKAISTTEKLIETSKQQKKALMQQLLTGKKRLVNPDTGKPFEGEWEEVRLSELGHTFTGLTGKTKEDFGSGAKYIPYINIFNNSSVNTAKLEKVLVDSGEKQNTVQYGDVFFTTSSETPDEVGMSSVMLSEPEEPIYLNSFCFGFRPNDTTTIAPEFMQYLLRSSQVRRSISVLAQGATRYNLSKVQLLKINLLLPTSVEQKKIASVLTAADKEIEVFEAKLTHFKQEKKALMQQLLTGKRRVSLSS